MFELKHELVRLEQEQDGAGFEGIRESYLFSGIRIAYTSHFWNEFGEEHMILIWNALYLLSSAPGEKERLQRFVYNGKQFWVISNWEEGTKKEDYIEPDELCIVFLMPSDY